jgi:hypothetical protein
MSELTIVTGGAWSRFAKAIDENGTPQPVEHLPKIVGLSSYTFQNLEDLESILTALRERRNQCVIRGALLPGVESPCRRLTKAADDDAATIGDVPRDWVLLDVDSIDEPTGLSFAADPDACARYIRSQLPKAFRNAGFVWRASGSAGFKPGIRLHLWFLLAQPIVGAELKPLLKASAVKLDTSVLGAVQPHFTADPVLAPGVVDPLTQRIGRVDGPRVVLVSKPEPIKVDVEPERYPFLNLALRKWDRDNPWDAPDMSTRFECPACGSSDGCAVLPDGKLFCHGAKHSECSVGTPANNGYVFHRAEAVECVTAEQLVPKLIELGYYPGKRVASADAENASAAADVMSAAVEGRTIDLHAAKKAKSLLKDALAHVRQDPSTLESYAYEIGRRVVPMIYSAGALREQLLTANRESDNAGSALLEVDAIAAVEVGLARARENPWIAPPPSALSVDDRGKALKCNANVSKLLSLPAFECVVWDERARRVLVISAPPWESVSDNYPRPFTDVDAMAIVVLLADNYDYPHASTSEVARQIALGAMRQSVDPVREYLEALDAFPGDLDEAREMCGSWLVQLAGAEDTDYVRAVSMRWLIAAVARTMQPGCQCREVLTLIGPQNIGKSSLLQNLVGRTWFKDDLNLARGPQQGLLGFWIVELAEIDKMVSDDRHGELKAFLSTAVDDYRMPYATLSESVPRRSVFAASSNVEFLFRDPTGNSRFNVVKTPGPFDIDTLVESRDELWSAARMLWASGEQWWLTSTEASQAREIQEAHRQTSDAELVILELLEQPYTRPVGGMQLFSEQLDESKRLKWVTSAQVYDYLRERGITRNVHKQAAETFERAGWIRDKNLGANRTLRGYRKP